jgi:hypothetical protein
MIDKDELAYQLIDQLSQTSRNRMEEIRRLREERSLLRGEIAYWLVELTRRIEHFDDNGQPYAAGVLTALKVDYEDRIKRLPGAGPTVADAQKLADQMAEEDGPPTQQELEDLRKVWPHD